MGSRNSLYDKLDEMLKRPEVLTKGQLEWVRKIDKTISGFRSTQWTPRQREVLEDIYSKFRRQLDAA